MRILLGLLLSAPGVAAAGQGTAPCQASIEKGWVRMAPGMPMGAAFAVLRNRCTSPVTIVGASSPAFGDVSLHETRVEGGVSRMRPVARIVVPVGGTVELRPGGLHAMLMEPRGAPARGTSVRIEFALADGRRLVADLPVRMTAP